MKRSGDGSTVGDHLAALRAQGVALPEDDTDDDTPGLEPALVRLWAVWRDLNATRSSGMAANPISYGEIEAFCRLTGEHLDPWEARAVRAVDDAYMLSLAAGHDEGGTT